MREKGKGDSVSGDCGRAGVKGRESWPRALGGLMEVVARVATVDAGEMGWCCVARVIGREG